MTHEFSKDGEENGSCCRVGWHFGHAGRDQTGQHHNDERRQSVETDQLIAHPIVQVAHFGRLGQRVTTAQKEEHIPLEILLRVAPVEDTGARFVIVFIPAASKAPEGRSGW